MSFTQKPPVFEKNVLYCPKHQNILRRIYMFPIRPAAALGLCFALGPICAGFFVYKGLVGFKSADRYITVKGLVERIEKSDRGTYTLRFVVVGDDLPELYKEFVAATNLTKDFLTKEGFKEKEISFDAPRFRDNHAYSTPTAARYTIDGTVIVDSINVDALKALSGKLTDLIGQGVPLTSSELEFYLDRFNDLRPQLIIDATKNAQKMGESIAQATGQKLGGVRYVNQGVINISGPNVKPDQTNSADTSTLMKKIRVLATVEFFID